MKPSSPLFEHLVYLYGNEVGSQTANQLENLLEQYRGRLESLPVPPALDQGDAVLITYGDQFQRPGEPPLQTLAAFCEAHLSGLVSGIHILPFYPSTSDDGFSVSDYFSIDPVLGAWEDIEKLRGSFRLMFDAVINHTSQSCLWFQEFLRDTPRFRDYYLEIDPKLDLSSVFRPRALPLLTAFASADGEKWIWTTFSTDQVDLNYQNPAVLLDITRVLLEYISRGAQIIRLDAIAFLWKSIGTSCIHLDQTHRVVRFFRSLLDEAAPFVLLITETNVPHQENISYFGDGSNEAQMVYNFALPPLVAHTLTTGSAAALSNWARTLLRPSSNVTFFNFLASHDGIGITPARGLLGQDEIDGLVERVLKHGGKVSYKNNPDGSQSPYELNISYFDAISDPAGNEPVETQIARFLVSQAILLAMPGLPAIYVHSLLGSRSWQEGVLETGRNRTINRQKFQYDKINAELDDSDTLRSKVFNGYQALLRARAASSAFHPYGNYAILDYGSGIFALQRFSTDGKHKVICLHNVTTKPIQIQIPDTDSPSRLSNLILEAPVQIEPSGDLLINPYQVIWLG